MATTIKLKNGSGAPLAGDLVQGEPALDLTNKRLYTEDSGGTVIEVGTNPTSLTTGTFTSTGIDDNATSTAITIDSSENVGIGTASPSTVLDIVKPSSAIAPTLNLERNTYNYIQFDASGGASAEAWVGIVQGGNNNFTISNQTSADILFNTNATERMRIDSSGRVGIGTSSPTTKLQLGASEDAISWKSGNGIIECPTNLFLRSTSGGNVLLNVGGGKVGIGTDNPTYKVTTSGTTGFVIDTEALLSDAGVTTIGVVAGGESINLRASGTGFHQFSNGSAEVMRIDSSGNVGIGVSDPDVDLEVQSAAGTLKLSNNSAKSATESTVGKVEFAQHFGLNVSSSIAGIEQGGTTDYVQGGMIFQTRPSGGSLTERMRIDSSGNLLIGRTADSGTGLLQVSEAGIVAQFDRSSGTAALVNFTYGGVDAGFITSSAGGTPSFSAASDQRLKENIQDHASELANVNAIRTATWDWKDKAKGSGEGVIAQELQQTGWADLVSEGDDGFLQVAGINKVETRLIKAIQELSAQVNELKAEVAALKGA